MFIRPNWKDVKAYRESESMSLGGGIAWEFLRRNPEYQKEMAMYQLELISVFEKTKKEILESLNNPKSSDWICSRYGCFEQLSPDRAGYWRELIQQKWGLNCPRSVNSEWDGDGFIFPAIDQPETFERVKYMDAKGPRVLIEADLSEPLETLLKKTEHLIRMLRTRGIACGTVKPVTARILKPAVYVKQLRILDAIDAGETIEKIGEVVLPGARNDLVIKQRNKGIRAAHMAALKMQNGGYRVLI